MHRHRWVFRNACNVNIVLPSGRVYDHKTEILYTCKTCEKPKTRRINGHWAEELTHVMRASQLKEIADALQS